MSLWTRNSHRSGPDDLELLTHSPKQCQPLILLTNLELDEAQLVQSDGGWAWHFLEGFSHICLVTGLGRRDPLGAGTAGALRLPPPSLSSLHKGF